LWTEFIDRLITYVWSSNLRS